MGSLNHNNEAEPRAKNKYLFVNRDVIIKAVEKKYVYLSKQKQK